MSVRSFALAVSVTALAATASLLGTQPAPAAPTAAPTAAARGWEPVHTLAGNPRGEAVAVDARSTITVVWATRSSGSVVAARRPAGGGWGEPVVIGRGHDPKVAVDRRGNVTVVWLTQRPGFTDGVAAARRPVGGDWTTPVQLTRDVEVPGYVPDGESPYGAAVVDLAVSPSGAAVVAWSWGSDDRGKQWRIESVQRPPGGPWGAPVAATPASGAKDPQVGIAADGAVTLVYGRQRFGHPRVLKSRQRRAGAWSDASVVATESYGESLTVDRAGNAIVVFTPDFNRVDATYRPAGRRWRAARTLSPDGATINDFSLAGNGRGRAVVLLGRGSGRVDLVQRPPGGPWSAPERVARPGTTVYDVVVALNGAGDTFAGWGGTALYGTYRQSGGTWRPRFTISPDAGVDVLEATFAAVAPNGDAVVLWEQEARPLRVRVLTAP